MVEIIGWANSTPGTRSGIIWSNSSFTKASRFVLKKIATLRAYSMAPPPPPPKLSLPRNAKK
jgi:hypothetical protein